ncbi:uncharacterized protein LOC135394433 isoform X2 [Ornithodoros turicata]
MKCLKARVLENKKKLTKCRLRQNQAEKELRRILQPDDMQRVFVARKHAETTEKTKRTNVHNEKLSRLIPRSSTPSNPNTVFNLSSKRLSDDHVSLLSKGLDFALTPRAPATIDFIIEVEDKLRHLKNTTGVNLARSRIATTLSNLKAQPSNLNKQKQAALRDLKSDESIITLPADKGKGTVVMDKIDYDGKMLKILDDPTHFKKVAHDPIPKSERSLIDHLRNFKKKDCLDEETYRRLFSSDGSIPRLYGLPKVHKPECPLRPIVSFIGSPTYKLSKYLVELISPVTSNNNMTVRNSREFVQLVRDQVIDEEDIMVSFDVVSLFTNVPVATVVEVAETRLHNDSSLPSRTSLTVEDIIILLRFCLKQSYFTFKGRVYQQIEGCPMGSPVSVTMANLIMEHVEEQALQKASFPVKFYRRYVDDTFVILNRNHVHDLHSILDNVEPSVRFTYEVEQNSVLPFLDVSVRQAEAGHIETTVHRKPCDTGNFLHLISHHPPEHKRSMVNTLLDRAKHLASTPELRASEENTVQRSLTKRGYPPHFIKNTRKRIEEKKQPREGTSKQGVVTILYVSGVSESIRRALLPLGIRTTFKPHIR